MLTRPCKMGRSWADALVQGVFWKTLWRRMKHHKYQKQAGDKQNPQGIHVSQQKPIKRRTWNPPGLFFLIFVLRHFCTLRRGRGGICCLRKVKALPFLQVLRRCRDDVSTPFLRSKDLCLSSSIPIHSYPFPSVFSKGFPFQDLLFRRRSSRSLYSRRSRCSRCSFLFSLW